MCFDSIPRPRDNQQGDLYNGFLFNRNRQLDGTSEMPSFQDAFQSAPGFFYPTNYGNSSLYKKLIKQSIRGLSKQYK